MKLTTEQKIENIRKALADDKLTPLGRKHFTTRMITHLQKLEEERMR